VKDADEEQFREFMVGKWPTLVRLAYGLTGDRGLAEDLAQTTLANVYASWPKVSRASSPDAYTFRMLLNANNGRFRKRRVAERPAEAVPEPEAGGPDPTDAVDERTVLMSALMELPPRQRATVLLRYFEDLSEAQTAEILGCSVGTVKSQTSSALARLRQSPHLAEGGAR
jgi:RNA polymerase sigma-70 factor (sigma-E family)